jgi:hypothetical protein
MAIIVEDGSGKKLAVSYGTEAGFRAYFLARNINVTALAQSTVEALLVTATDYIDTRWGLKFLGQRLFSYLTPRSEFTLSDQPADGETVTVGLAVATFRTTATLDTEAEIGTTITETLNNLTSALAAADADAANQFVSDFLIADPDTPTLTCYVVREGVATTTDAANGSFDAATSSGYSGRPQVLEFPRAWLYDRAGILVEGIPVRLKEATYEYAYRANSTTLSPDPTTDTSGLRVKATEKKVGPVVTKTEYAEQQIPSITKPYPAADRLLQEYVSTGGIIRN